MNTISPEIISKLSANQPTIWQTVSLIVSEAVGQAMTFADPLCVSTKSSDLFSEITGPMMVINFSLAGAQDNSQVILIPQDTVLQLATVVRSDSIEDIDENLVSDMRPMMEGIVQGLCLSIGNLRNETSVASGLSIRYQIFSFPQNLQRSLEIVRTQVAIDGPDITGSILWLIDPETAHNILRIPMPDEASLGGAFPQISAGTSDGAQNRPVHPLEDPNGLELLLDIPLELSVELGRVKMLVKDIIELSTGSIVEIDKSAGEPVDVMVNGRLVARGEVVVIEDNFGVRITEILNPHERLNRLSDAA